MFTLAQNNTLAAFIQRYWLTEHTKGYSYCTTEGASSPVCHVTHRHWTDRQPYNYKFDCSQWHLRVTDWGINTYENSMFHFDKELLILKQESFREISGFYHRTVEAFAVLRFCAALGGVSLLTFRDIISVPSSRIKHSKNLDCLTPWHLKIGPMGCTETSANTYQPTLHETLNSEEIKHEFNIWRRSIQHMHKNKKKKTVQIENEGALWVDNPPFHECYRPASAHYKESYHVLEIYYKLPVLKI